MTVSAMHLTALLAMLLLLKSCTGEVPVICALHAYAGFANHKHNLSAVPDCKHVQQLTQQAGLGMLSRKIARQHC